MSNATDALARTRPMLAGLIERKSRATQSKMRAIEAIASEIGASSSWVQKVIYSQTGIVVRHHVFVNIASAYARLCERIETEAQIERARAMAILEGAHASIAGDQGMGARLSGPQGGREGSTAAV
jgi:AraC-like DNA-binding protein